MGLQYPSYADKVIFVDLLAEGTPETSPATQVELDAWIEDRQLPFTTAIDPPDSDTRIVEVFSPIENAFLVELQSMKIVEHVQAPSMLYPTLDAL